MPRIRSVSLALMLAACVTGAAVAEDQPLTGTWRYLEPAGVAGPATEVVMQFLANGSYEMRRTNASSSEHSSGFILITGRLWRTGPDSYVTVAETAMACATPGSCRPYPNGGPSVGLGTLTSARFHVVGEGEMTVNGERWVRLHQAR